MFKSLYAYYRQNLRAWRIKKLKETNAAMRELKEFMDARRKEAQHWGESLIIGDWHWHNLEPLLKRRLLLADKLGVSDAVAARLR